MKAELIVFDLAGTTVKDNKDVHRVLQSALKQFGIEISIAQANEVMGIPKPIAIKQLLEEVKFNSITEEFIMDVHKKFIEEMIDFYQNDSGVGEKSGVSATFQKLKQNGIRVVVDTGFDRLYITHSNKFHCLINHIGERSASLYFIACYTGINQSIFLPG